MLKVAGIKLWSLKVCSHLTSFSPFNVSPFNGPFFASTVSIVFMKNGQNGLKPILLKKRAVSMHTMLIKKRAVKRSSIKRAKRR